MLRILNELVDLVVAVVETGGVEEEEGEEEGEGEEVVKEGLVVVVVVMEGSVAREEEGGEGVGLSLVKETGFVQINRKLVVMIYTSLSCDEKW